MRPLAILGLGLVVVVLDLSLVGFDFLVDPVGWVIVFVGCSGLPKHLDAGLLTGTAFVAGLVSLPLVLPSVVGGLSEELAWALSLPQVVFVVLLARAMSRAAAGGGDHSARGWWRLVLWGVVVLALLPPVVYGAGIESLVVAGAFAGLAAVVAAIVMCFRHAGRPWAHAPAAPVPS